MGRKHTHTHLLPFFAYDFSSRDTSSSINKWSNFTYSRSHASFHGGNQNNTKRHLRGYPHHHYYSGHHIHIADFFFNLTYSRWISSLPSCLWSQRIFPSLPGSRLTIFYRDASSALLQLVNQWLNFYLPSFPSFPLRKKDHT